MLEKEEAVGEEVLKVSGKPAVKVPGLLGGLGCQHNPNHSHCMTVPGKALCVCVCKRARQRIEWSGGPGC